MLSRSAFVGVGLVSYPLYLWHWPLLSFAYIASNGMPAVGVRIALAAAAVVLATATYALVEKPIRFGTALPHYKVPALAIASLAIGAIGFVTFVRGGAPERFPPGVQALANFNTNTRSTRAIRIAGSRKISRSTGLLRSARVHRPAAISRSSGAIRTRRGSIRASRTRSASASRSRNSRAIRACPPLAIAYAICQQSNAWVVGEIARLRPKVVILFASWTHYQVDWKVPSAAKTSLLATLDALRLAGVPKIVVVGPAPVWKGGLPKAAYNAWLDARPFHVVPEYLDGGRELGVTAADIEMRREVEAHGAVYFSMMDFFCNVRGCLTHAPESETRLVTWDSGHLNDRRRSTRRHTHGRRRSAALEARRANLFGGRRVGRPRNEPARGRERDLETSAVDERQIRAAAVIGIDPRQPLRIRPA